MHVLEKLWEAGRARYAEGSKELAAWVDVQEDRLYADDAVAVLSELRVWLAETPKTGPGNKGRRKWISNAIRYLDNRLDKLAYGTCLVVAMATMTWTEMIRKTAGRTMMRR